MPPALPSAQDLFGPMLIGLLLDAVLLGILAMQVVSYFYRYPRDRGWFKVLVAYLLIADIANTACDFATVYEPLILKFGANAFSVSSPTFLPADPITTIMISTPVQLFMCWRVRVITNSVLLPLVIATFSMVSLGGGVWLGYEIFIDTVSQIRSLDTQRASALWLIASGVTDIAVTASIVYIIVVSQRRQKKRLDGYLGRIVRLTVEAGAVTSFSVIFTFLIFMTVKKGPYFLIWDLCTSKLYSISLVASLNARPVKFRRTEKAALFLDDSSPQHSAASGLAISTTVNMNVSASYPGSAPFTSATPRTAFKSPVYQSPTNLSARNFSPRSTSLSHKAFPMQMHPGRNKGSYGTGEAVQMHSFSSLPMKPDKF